MATTRIPASTLIAERLRAMFADGTYPAETQLPPEPELSAELGTSRATLREALRMLSDDGLIRRIHGVGTFVNRVSVIRNSLHLNFGVSQLIAAEGLTPGTRESRVVVGRPPDDVRAALDLGDDDEVVTVERVRTADGEPVVFSLDHLPTRFLGGASVFIGDSIYRFLSEVAGVTVDHGEAVLRPATADARLAGQLGVDEGSLLFVIDQTDYDADGVPVLHSVEWHLAEAFTFRVIRRGPTNSMEGRSG